MSRETVYKWLIFLSLVFSISVFAMPPKDAGGWFEGAREARRSGDLVAAVEALDKAEQMGFAPLRVAFERARLHTLGESPELAIAELQSIAESGFASVGFITNDPILSTLAGTPAYEAVLADMASRAYPCENDEAFRAFDFWIGEWEVHLADGTPAGTNSIQPAERGCVLIENWINSAGGTGMSINYLDKATDEWVQVWNAEGGSQINIRGGMTEQGMVLAGTIHDIASATTSPLRGTWTLLEDGRVRQFFEQSSDGGKTWAPWFEGFYTRKQ